MGKALFLAGNVGFIVIYALIANALGRSNLTFTVPTAFVAPEDSSIFDIIIAPIAWAFDAVGVFFSLITFAFVGVDPLIFTVLIGPLFIIDIFIIIGMIRGGGTS